MDGNSVLRMPDGDTLAQQQTALVAALVSGAPLPSGFDHHKASVVADILRTKRRKALRHAAPELSALLGTEWRQLFDSFAANTVVASNGTPLDDAIAFSAWCRRTSTTPLSLFRVLICLYWRRIVTRARPSQHAFASEGMPSSPLRDDSETRMM